MSELEEIYEKYGTIVYRYLLGLSHDSHVAEELTQETMFRAVMNIGTFRGDSKISVWLCQIAKNLFYEWQKKQNRTVSLDGKIGPEPRAADDPALDLENKDMADRILRCLHTLKEPYKEVFTLHALGEISLKQISILFGKSESWARVTYYRAKAMIKEKLEGGAS